MKLPDTAPVLYKRYQLTEFGSNHNKFWAIKAWNVNGLIFIQTVSGRVGISDNYSPRDGVKEVNGMYAVDALIASKERKGYREVQLNNQVQIDFGSDAVGRLIKMLMEEASEHIATYLAGDVSELHPDQIAHARQQLQIIQINLNLNHDPTGAVQEFFNIIPTRLPMRYDVDEVVREFAGNLREQEERLDQLEAALAPVESVDPCEVLGAQVSDDDDGTFGDVAGMIEATGGSVDQIFSVLIPGEREAYSDVGNPRPLFHGSKNRNYRHILKSGLILPRTKDNGWMFGPGIYFADMAQKSLNYTSARYGNPKCLLVAQVSIGTPYVADENMNVTEPPSGYDSVMGKANHTKSWGGRLAMNEFIVYRQTQQTITHLVTLR